MGAHVPRCSARPGPGRIWAALIWSAPVSAILSFADATAAAQIFEWIPTNPHPARYNRARLAGLTSAEFRDGFLELHPSTEAAAGKCQRPGCKKSTSRRLAGGDDDNDNYYRYGLIAAARAPAPVGPSELDGARTGPAQGPFNQSVAFGPPIGNNMRLLSAQAPGRH